jgi:hypothetical protein
MELHSVSPLFQGTMKDSLKAIFKNEDKVLSLLFSSLPFLFFLIFFPFLKNRVKALSAQQLPEVEDDQVKQISISEPKKEKK